MWCFSEIFAGNTEKANLITAILSVIAAVIVVYLTHALAHRRSRHELNSKKIEELYEAATEFFDAGWFYIHELTGPHENNLNASNRYHEAYSKVEMLASIYATDILNQINETNVIVVATQEGENIDSEQFIRKLREFSKTKQNTQAILASKARKFV